MVDPRDVYRAKDADRKGVGVVRSRVRTRVTYESVQRSKPVGYHQTSLPLHFVWRGIYPTTLYLGLQADKDCLGLKNGEFIVAPWPLLVFKEQLYLKYSTSIEYFHRMQWLLHVVGQ